MVLGQIDLTAWRLSEPLSKIMQENHNLLDYVDDHKEDILWFFAILSWDEDGIDYARHQLRIWELRDQKQINLSPPIW